MPTINTMVQLLPPTPTLSGTVHTVTDGRTDRQTDDSMMPITDHYVYQYDRLTRSGVARISREEGHETLTKYFLGDRQKYYEIHTINSDKAIGVHIFSGHIGNHIESNVRDSDFVRV